MCTEHFGFIRYSYPYNARGVTLIILKYLLQRRGNLLKRKFCDSYHVIENFAHKLRMLRSVISRASALCRAVKMCEYWMKLTVCDENF
jgi:hypothetical protein